MKNFLIAFFLWFVAGCSIVQQTTVREIKNTGLNRFTHGSVSKFNILENGKIAFHQGLLNAELERTENYFHLIPVFGYDHNPENTHIYFQYAIKKGLKVIARHSIFESGVEFSPYVDDAYLLLGKSTYMMGKYEEAHEIFHFFTSKFPYSSLAYEAMIWDAKSLNKLEYLSMAREKLDSLEKDTFFPQELKTELYLTQADYLLQNLAFDDALQKLYNTLKYKLASDQKNRIQYLIAQLEFRKNQFGVSKAYAKQVGRKWNILPVFKLNCQLLSLKSGFTKTQTHITKTSRKYSKLVSESSENPKFLENIYLSFGNFLLRAGKNEEAMQQYGKAKLVAQSNDIKFHVYTNIAEYYFSNSKYSESLKYYDSALNTIDTTLHDAEQFTDFHTHILQISEWVKRIETNEKLLYLSNLDKANLEKTLEEIKQERIEKERKKIEEEQAEVRVKEENRKKYEQDQVIFSNVREKDNQQWYFDNPKLRRQGIEAFTSYWGNRANVDNWKFRELSLATNNKQNLDVSPSTSEESIHLDPEVLKKRLEKAGLTDHLLVSIPKTENDKIQLKQSIIEDYYELSKLFLYTIKDYKKTEFFLNKRLSDYPLNFLKLESLYMLFYTFEKGNQIAESEKIKTRILTEFPDSKIAQRLLNLDSISSKEIEEEYSKIVSLYEIEKFETALTKLQNLMPQINDIKILEKALFLELVLYLKIGNQKKAYVLLKDIQTQDENLKKTIEKIRKKIQFSS